MALVTSGRGQKHSPGSLAMSFTLATAWAITLMVPKSFEPDGAARRWATSSWMVTNWP